MCLVVNGHKTLEGFFIFSLRVVVARYSQLIKRLPSADKSVTLKHSTKLCGFTRLVGPFVAEIYSGDGDCVYHFFFSNKRFEGRDRDLSAAASEADRSQFVVW